MCFAVIASVHGETILAADQRIVLRGRDAGDASLFMDIPGSRLHRIARGWLSGLGSSGLYVRHALAHLLLYDANDVDAIAHHLSVLASTAPARLADQFAFFGLGELEACRFLVAADSGRIAILDHDGTVLADARSGGGGVYPGDANGAEIPRNGEDLRRAVRASKSKYDLIRAAATEFAAVGAMTPTVSPVIEVGAGSSVITGSAERLACADDEQLRALMAPHRAPNVSAFDPYWMAKQLRDWHDGLLTMCTVGTFSG